MELWNITYSVNCMLGFCPHWVCTAGRGHICGPSWSHAAGMGRRGPHCCCFSLLWTFEGEVRKRCHSDRATSKHPSSRLDLSWGKCSSTALGVIILFPEERRLHRLEWVPSRCRVLCVSAQVRLTWTRPCLSGCLLHLPTRHFQPGPMSLTSTAPTTSSALPATAKQVSVCNWLWPPGVTRWLRLRSQVMSLGLVLAFLRFSSSRFWLASDRNRASYCVMDPGDPLTLHLHCAMLGVLPQALLLQVPKHPFEIFPLPFRLLSFELPTLVVWMVLLPKVTTTWKLGNYLEIES